MIRFMGFDREPGGNARLGIFLLDSATDKANLPTTTATDILPAVDPGSVAYTADGENVYVLSPSNVWEG